MTIVVARAELAVRRSVQHQLRGRRARENRLVIDRLQRGIRKLTREYVALDVSVEPHDETPVSDPVALDDEERRVIARWMKPPTGYAVNRSRA